MKPFSLFRDALRARYIIATLVRHGFAEFLQELELPGKWLQRLVAQPKEHLNVWQRIRAAVEDLGPTFVKMGQVLSSRPDVLPQPLIDEFRLLREQVGAVEWSRIETVLLEELDGPLENHFQEFEQNPRASASLGQVYYARLTGSGREVAVKVQRPGIRRAIEADLEILGWLARQVHQRVPEWQGYDLPSVVQELRQGLLQELDFTYEARNASLFNVLNPYPNDVFAAEVIEEFTTTRLVVSEWVEGFSPSRGGWSDEERARLARAGARSVFHQIVVSGFFHGDPHTGNLVVTKDGRICFLDWGLAGQLTREMRYFLADLLGAVTSWDPERVVRIATRMNRSTRRIDRSRMEKEVMQVLLRYRNQVDPGKVIGRIILDLIYVFGTSGIAVARDYTLLAKAVVSLEETGRTFDPAFDLADSAKPFLRGMEWERRNPANVIHQVGVGVEGGWRKLVELPDDLQRVLRRFEEEDLSINLHHKGVGPVIDELSAGVNRLVYAIIVAALIIGSSLVIRANVPPLLWETYPIIGVLGYLGSAVLGIWLVVDILRHGRMK